MKQFANLALFQISWCACAFGAAAGRGEIGIVVVTVCVALQLFFSKTWLSELGFVLAVAAIGTAYEIIWLSLDQFSFPHAEISFLGYPLWMSALWANFATTLFGCLKWLRGRYLLGATFGLIGGPLTYYAGMKIGAISLQSPIWLSLLIVGFSWALIMPALLLLAKKMLRDAS